MATDNDEVWNTALACEFSGTGAPSCVVPSKNTTVPVGVPEVREVTVAVNVTCWPELDGFGDDVSTVVVAAPVAACDVPKRATGMGLPGTFTATRTLPLTRKLGNVSVPGAKTTLMVQEPPGARLTGQLFVWVKFSLIVNPLMENAVSPALLNVTACAALFVPIA